MPVEGDTLKLLKTALGLHSPKGEEVYRLAGVAGLNKLHLPYLERVSNVLSSEYSRELARVAGYAGRAYSDQILVHIRRLIKHIHDYSSLLLLKLENREF